VSAAGPDPADAALLAAAIAEAGTLAASLFQRGVRVWDKTPGNPVTEADYAIDALLKARLRAARPDYGWLSEETADDAARLNRRRLWVVDAIDGTRDFLRGRHGWAVSVALIEDGVPVLGALSAPLLGEQWFARRGGGTTLNGAPVRVGTRTDPAGARISADPDVAARAGFRPVPKPNALALRMARVAQGEADLFLEERPIRENDVAASTLLVTEAGGLATDAGGQPLAFNALPPRLDGVVAANPGLHAALMARVRQP
jgi:myo-inositol-1(or 4)-monophosphatase